MSRQAREFVDFWIENSIHAVEQFGAGGATQNVADLVERLVENAKAQGISEADMKAEIGELDQYIEAQLKAANKTESDRQSPS